MVAYRARGRGAGGGGGLLPSSRLMGMCCWMGSYFHDWFYYYEVVFLEELLECWNGVAHFQDLGVRKFRYVER